MLEMMPRDTNVNLYQMHTFFADAPSKSVNLPIPNTHTIGLYIIFIIYAVIIFGHKKLKLSVKVYCNTYLFMATPLKSLMHYEWIVLCSLKMASWIDKYYNVL